MWEEYIFCTHEQEQRSLENLILDGHLTVGNRKCSATPQSPFLVWGEFTRENPFWKILTKQDLLVSSAVTRNDYTKFDVGA
jgi:hypothetical protein